MKISSILIISSIIIFNPLLVAGGASSQLQSVASRTQMPSHTIDPAITRLTKIISLFKTPVLLLIQRNRIIPEVINIHEGELFLLLVEQELKKNERLEGVKKIEDDEKEEQKDRDMQRISNMAPKARNYHTKRKQRNNIAFRKEAFLSSFKRSSINRSAKRLSNSKEQIVLRAVATFNESREASSNIIPGQVN